jgi:site-specific recombinase XerD
MPAVSGSRNRQLPGRTDITTTQRYMHLDERELAEAQDLIE